MLREPLWRTAGEELASLTPAFWAGVRWWRLRAGFWVNPGSLLRASCCLRGGPRLASVECPYSFKGWPRCPGACFRSSGIRQQSRSPATPTDPLPGSTGFPRLSTSANPLESGLACPKPVQGACTGPRGVRGDGARAARGRVNLGLCPCSLLGLWGRTAHPAPSQSQPGSA